MRVHRRNLLWILPLLMTGCFLPVSPPPGSGDGGPSTVSDGGSENIGDGDGEGPVATISSPADGAFILSGSSVLFEGAAQDPQDGALTGTALVWSIDGVAFGAGNQVQTAIPDGDHLIALDATDSDGHQGAATLTLHVVDDLPPTVNISSPVDGLSVLAGASIQFDVSANDAEDGALSGLSVVWTANDNILGSGSSIQTALPLGAYQIRVEATDSAGQTGTDEVALNVVGMLPTQCTLSSPTAESEHVIGATVTFLGACAQGDGTPLQGAQLQWTSDVQGPLGFGGTVVTALSTLGTHVISLCAVLDPGLEPIACESISIEVADTVCGDAALGGTEQCDLGTSQNVGHYDGCFADCTQAAACPVGDCRTCGLGEMCQPQCDQGDTCIVQCAQGADCQVDGSDNGTDLSVECSGTDVCDVKCDVNNTMSCAVSCSDGATCDLECKSDNGQPYPCTCTADATSTCNVMTEF